MGRPCKLHFRFLKYFNKERELVCIDLGAENSSNSKKQKHPKCKKPKQVDNAQDTFSNTNVVCPQANIIGENTNFETSEQLVFEDQIFYANFEYSIFEDEDNDIFFPFE